MIRAKDFPIKKKLLLFQVNQFHALFCLSLFFALFLLIYLSTHHQTHFSLLHMYVVQTKFNYLMTRINVFNFQTFKNALRDLPSRNFRDFSKCPRGILGIFKISQNALGEFQGFSKFSKCPRGNGLSIYNSKFLSKIYPTKSTIF